MGFNSGFKGLKAGVFLTIILSLRLLFRPVLYPDGITFHGFSFTSCRG